MNKRFVHLLLTFVFALAGLELYGQQKKVLNLPGYDNHIVHFGFLVGINSADFRIVNKPSFAGYDSLDYIQSFKQSGFNLGIISNLHLGDMMDLRFVPTLSFSSRTLEYVFNTPKTGLLVKSKNVESTFLDFPLLLKVKSRRHNNFRAYALGGIRYCFDLASEKDVKDDPSQALVKIYDNDYGLELGVGFDLYLTYFKLSPEIRYFFGVNNMLVKSGNVYSDPIDRLTSKIILVSFNFE